MRDMKFNENDDAFMKIALLEAKKAFERDEIPVGAVLVKDDKIIAQAHNEKEQRQDSTAHAEILCLQRASKILNTWNLSNSTMYCTLEPCTMCAGALLHARIERLVFAVKDKQAGAGGSMIDILRYPGLNHQVQVEFGLREIESAALLQSFFKDLRRDGRAGRRRSTRNRVDGE